MPNPHESPVPASRARFGILLCFTGLSAALLTAALPKAQASAPSEQTSQAVRLERASRPLLGAEYVLSPLGEGHGTDADPRFRLDAFDCTTFVETSMALARLSPEQHSAVLVPGGDSSSVEMLLDQLRYSGEPTFENRRHLMAAQWLPDLAALGQIEDITREVGGALTRTAPLTLDLERWESRRIARSLELPPEKVPAGEFPLDYIALEDLETLIEQIPPGSLLNVVREPVVWAPLLISHQALLLEKPLESALSRGARAQTSLVVRHASAALGRVADQTPAQFLAILEQQRNRPVVGLNIWRVTLGPLP